MFNILNLKFIFIAYKSIPSNIPLKIYPFPKSPCFLYAGFQSKLSKLLMVNIVYCYHADKNQSIKSHDNYCLTFEKVSSPSITPNMAAGNS